MNRVMKHNTTGLKNLLSLRNLPFDIKRRVEEEYYINPALAMEMVQTCHTLKECDELYFRFYRLDTRGGSSLSVPHSIMK